MQQIMEENMKKILIFTLVLVIGLLPISACSQSDNVIRINEVTHSLFYAPFYLADSLGIFEKNGIKIDLVNGGGSDASMTALISNSADVALCGPETTIYVYQQGREDYPVVFGQLTKRDGAFLVGRNFEPNFDWQGLENKHVIMGRKGGMPAMTLQYILNSFGYVDGQNITMDYSVQFNMLGPTFASGVGDYVTLFEPTASQIEAQGSGHILTSIGTAGGEIPYTCFIATQSYLKNNKNKLEKFLRSVHEATMWLLSNDNLTVAQKLTGAFVGTDVNDIANAIGNYRSADAWKTTPSMTKESFEKLQDVMQNAGELTTRVEFEKLINNSIADLITL